MTEIQNSKQYDLEERTMVFARKCRTFVQRLQRTIGNIEDGKQLIRSSGSVAANYIEANESLSRKDFFHRIKICRKEAKESRLWLQLVNCDEQLQSECKQLLQEATELMKIFGAILERAK